MPVFKRQLWFWVCLMGVDVIVTEEQWRHLSHTQIATLPNLWHSSAHRDVTLSADIRVVSNCVRSEQPHALLRKRAMVS